MIFALCGAVSPAAQADGKRQDDTKFNFLLHFFDMNEAAFAYHRHCLATSEGLDEKFLDTMRYVADAIFAEAQRASPKVNPDFFKKQILERRYKIQYELDTASMRDGCSSANAQKAAAHYREFSRYDLDAIEKYIAEKSGE